MNLFNTIFRHANPEGKQESGHTQLQKGDIIISFSNQVNYKVIRPISGPVKENLNSSNLTVIQSPIYSHYWTDNLIYKGRNDQNWQNQAVFFWENEEPFARKSLPPVFDTYTTRRFVFVSNKNNVSLNHGKVMPWFGMPGMGEKYFCEISNEKVAVTDLKTLGIIQYIEPVELTVENLDILTDPDNYFILTDERIVQYKNRGFYVQDNLVSNELAYSIGGIQIIKKISK